MTRAHLFTEQNTPDQVLLDRWKKIPVAVAVDLLPTRYQIDPAIRPLLPSGQQPGLFGFAFTALCAPPDFGAVLQALRYMKAGDVLVIDGLGNKDYAMIGDVLGGYLVHIGASGIVCDGAVRDTATLAQFSSLPVYTRHINPRGPKGASSGRIKERVTIGGCDVHPGDLIIGDDDGLIAIPVQELAIYIDRCEDKLNLEEIWKARLKSGEDINDIFNLHQSP